MLPKIVNEPYNLAIIFSGAEAWYNTETNTIHIADGLGPRWLVILHELGHWLIGFIPGFIHRRISLDFWYDVYWERLGLSKRIYYKPEVHSSLSTANESVK